MSVPSRGDAAYCKQTAAAGITLLQSLIAYPAIFSMPLMTPKVCCPTPSRFGLVLNCGACPSESTLSAHIARSAAAGLPCSLQMETDPLLQDARMGQAQVLGGMTTRSRAKRAMSGLPVSGCPGEEPASEGLRRCHALPEIPNGPLVISAGWGRTGTSSLKVPLTQRSIEATHRGLHWPLLHRWTACCHPSNKETGQMPQCRYAANTFACLCCFGRPICICAALAAQAQVR